MGRGRFWGLPGCFRFLGADDCRPASRAESAAGRGRSGGACCGRGVRDGRLGEGRGSVVRSRPWGRVAAAAGGDADGADSAWVGGDSGACWVASGFSGLTTAGPACVSRGGGAVARAAGAGSGTVVSVRGVDLLFVRVRGDGSPFVAGGDAGGADSAWVGGGSGACRVASGSWAPTTPGPRPARGVIRSAGHLFRVRRRLPRRSCPADHAVDAGPVRPSAPHGWTRRAPLTGTERSPFPSSAPPAAPPAAPDGATRGVARR
ncbi:hypothetical protein SAMN05216489_00933 [Streptomyces sp. 3213]|nr:hypothetical protein SAMN05216489_00933 [Streptomyces sp. 3213] [Streptomyces sp. 3213.3]